MKKYVFFLLVSGVVQVQAQQPAIPQPQMTPQQKAMLKQMGIDPSNPQKAAEQIKQLKKNGQMPDFKTQGQQMVQHMMADPKNKTVVTSPYHYFTSNAELMPAKDVKRINSITKKTFSDDEMLNNTKLLYGKMIGKLPAAEKTVITSAMSQSAIPEDLNKASVAAMMQGHRLAALGLAMQAVIAKPSNLNYQNNMAALLTENGYPENAVPYLNTLQQKVPGNSTVKNNLGYAWLNLGEKDSAQHFFSAGAILNPNNPETTCGGGLVDELGGDPIKSGDEYEQSAETDPSSMIEIMLGNKGKTNPYENMTYDQIKNKITIYEYFKKEWLTVGQFSNSTGGYQADLNLYNGYKEMFGDIMNRIKRIEDSLKSSNDSVGAMAYNAQAHNILKPIAAYYGPLQGKILLLEGLLDEWVKSIESKTGDLAYKANTCEARNSIWDSKYLQKVNPELQKQYPIMLEEYRVWINAFLTYVLLDMYLTPKERLLDAIYYVKFFINQCAIAATCLKSMQSDCGVNYDNERVTAVMEYELPKLVCPVNINTSQGINNSNITKSTNGTVPNVTVGMGSGDGEIAEPGKGGTPSVRSSQGQVTSKGYNGHDGYQALLNVVNHALANSNSDPQITIGDVTVKPGPSQRQIAEEIDQLQELASDIIAEYPEITIGDVKVKPGPSQRLADEEELAPLTALCKKHGLKDWLQHQLATNCEELKKMDQNPPPPPIDIKKEMDNNAKGLEEAAKQLSQQNNPEDAQRMETVKTLLDEVHKTQQSIETKTQADPGWVQKYGQATGSPTISNGLQNPGSNPSFIKGLFN